MKKDELIAYWTNSSDNDFNTMEHLFDTKDYHWALFIGHLVVEKLIKAYYVKNIANHPPRTHNLLRLSEKCELVLSEEQKDFLATVNAFNIRARYDDYKMDFYKICDKEFTQKWVEEIKGFRKWIKKKHLKS